MQGAAPTAPAWLGSWSPGLVYGQHVYNSVPEWYRTRARERARQRSRLTIYTYAHDTAVKLRLGPWPGGTVRPVTWERPVYPIDREPWHLTVPVPLPAPQHPNQRLYTEHMTESSSRPVGTGWTQAARGWGAGAALLALLVLLARAADSCIHRNLYKRRRRSQEWPTPTVRATTQSEGGMEDTLMIPGLELAPPLPAPPPPGADAPPPYSVCETHKTHHVEEEPPPPYSDCYVEFSNKGAPSVLLHTRHNQHNQHPHYVGSDGSHNISQHVHRDNCVPGLNIGQEVPTNNFVSETSDVVQEARGNLSTEIPHNIVQEVQQNNDNANTEAVLRVNINEYNIDMNACCAIEQNDGKGILTV